MFANRTWKSGFRPRVGDYLSWPCDEFEANRTPYSCYVPIRVLSIDDNINIDRGENGDRYVLNEFHVDYFLWYRPKKNIVVVINEKGR